MSVLRKEYLPEFLSNIPFGTGRVAKRSQGSGELTFVEDYPSHQDAVDAVSNLDAQYTDGTIHLIFGMFPAD